MKKIADGLAAILFGQPYQFPSERKEIPLDTSLLAQYAGIYTSGTDVERFVVLEGSLLFTNLSGQPRHRLLAQAPDTFFSAVDNSETHIFERDSCGHIVAHILFDELNAVRSLRLGEDLAAPLLEERTVVELKADFLDRYVGTYQLESDMSEGQADFTLGVIRRGAQLFAAANGTSEVALVAHSEIEFFHKVADFRLCFELNGNGEVTGCILQMGAAVVKGLKVK